MNAPLTTLPDIGQTDIATSEHDNLFQHVAIFLTNGQILSDETFKLHSFQGQDQIGQPFQLHLELHANTDNANGNVDFAFEDILTRPVTIGVNLPDAGPQDFARAIRGGAEHHLAFWNGIATDFAMGVPGVYHLTVKPALHRLSLTNRYHVHRQMSIRDVIESVLGDHGIVPSTAKPVRNCVSLSAISGADNPAVTRVQDWLQAGESDLDFLQRLLSRAHIYFFFEHHATYHRIVYANRPAYPPALADGRKLRYAETGTDTLGLEQDDLILDYQYSQTMSSTGVNGTLSRIHAAWEEDTVARFDTFRAQSDAQLGDLPFHRFQMYQYGGSDGEVRWDTEITEDTRSTAATAMKASSTCPNLRPGHAITLDEASAPNVNPRQIRPTLGERNFVLNSVQYQASLDGSFRASFEATESYGQIAGFSLHDTQQGSVLAEVVKHDNGEYPKDWRYYQRSAFDPETDKLRDSTANPKMLRPKGVYVRFATADPSSAPVWIKLAQHMLTAPELGVTVLVARANDNSELPEIQSIVQNNGHKTVVPGGWLASTSVGSNYQTSYGDSRSVRFGLNSPGNLPPAKTWVDDKYKQGNSDVSGWFSGVHLRDVSWSKGGSSNYSTAENGRADVLSESISIGSNYSKQDAYESKGISVVDHSWNKSTNITTYSDSTISQLAESHSKIGTSTSFSTIGTSNSTSDIGTSNSDNKVGISNSTALTGISNSASATGIVNSVSGTGIVNNASATGISTAISATGISTNLGATGIDTRLSMTGLNTTLSVTGLSTNIGAVGLNTSINATGLNTSIGATGLNTSINATGLNTSIGATGINTGINATGVTTDTNATGVSTRIGATGVSTNINATGVSTDISVTGVGTRISGTSVICDITVRGTGLSVIEDVGEIKTEASGLSADIVSILKTIL